MQFGFQPIVECGMASTSWQRFCKNQITSLRVRDQVFEAHDQKATILKDFYHNLLGNPPTTSWNFDLSDLYAAPVPQLRYLDAAFTSDEIKLAFLHMNPNASPGPDGFGPC